MNALAKSGPRLSDGPFIKVADTAMDNLRLLALLAPLAVIALFRHSPENLSWTWPAALISGFFGALAIGGGRALARLDWASGALLGGLILNMPGHPQLETGAAVFVGFCCGAASAFRPLARFRARPGFLALALWAATALLIALGSAVRPAETPLTFYSGPLSGLEAAIWITAGGGYALGRPKRFRALLVYWLAMAGLIWIQLWFGAPETKVESPLALEAFRRLSCLLPLFFFTALKAPRTQPVSIWKKWIIVLGLFLPPWPMAGSLAEAILPALFLPLFRPRVFKTPATGQAQKNPGNYKADLGQVRLSCAHQGSASVLAAWNGPSSCALLNRHDQGSLACPYGCLGLGDCARACPEEAITISQKGFPRIDRARCRACGACLAACPKGLFTMIPEEARVFIACASRSGLKQSAEYCGNSCLGCGRCRKACPAGAINRESDRGAMAVDQQSCQAYGPDCRLACVEACPRNIIQKTGE